MRRPLLYIKMCRAGGGKVGAAMDAFLQAAAARRGKLSAILDDLHRHPELSFGEHRTTARIRTELAALGLSEIETGMDTGVAAILRGAKPGPLVGIRADIDAIAETDRGGGPSRSEVPGVMHACGHDLHTTCALGAAMLLAGARETLCGSVAFIFQPAEEVTRGAAEMLRHGLLHQLPAAPKGMFSLHSAPFKTGLVGARCATMAAGKTNFRITLAGRAGQGGFPHECVDVIVAGAAMVDAVQTIVSRNADPREALVCGITNAHAGEHEFFITDKMVLSGSVRALGESTLRMALGRLEELVRTLPTAYGCGGALELIPEVPPLVNSPLLYPAARRAAELVAGAEHVIEPPPMLGSDDFAVFGQHMPIFYYQLGAMHPQGEDIPLHRPDFWVDPEAAVVGSALLAQAAFLLAAE